MLPLVSICTPVYNSASYIAETIESVLNQTYQNWEWILVNDGSTDHSAAIIKKINDPRIVLFEQENKGAAAARNVALSHSNGVYIQYLDADDLLPPDKIARQVAMFHGDEQCIIGCNWIRFIHSIDNTIGKTGPHLSIRKTCSALEWLLARHTMLIHCWLTPLSLIKKAGLWDEQLTTNDDGEYFSRVISNADAVLYCGDTIAYYRNQNPGGISSMISESDYQSIYLSAVSYKNVMTKLAPEAKEVKIAIGNTFKELVYFLYPKYQLLVEQCMQHPEIKISTSKYNPGGPFTRCLVLLTGWKITRRLIFLWKKFNSKN